MNKRNRKRALPVACAIAALTAGCAWKYSEAGSVGIIGGADGPTAVFVATRFAPWVWVAAALLLLAAAAGIILLIRGKHK